MTSQGKSYRQILRTSSIIGGSSIITILTGIAKTKILAVLLGPSGIGLIGLFTNILTTTSTFAGLGLKSSGIRQVAEATGKGDDELITTVRRALWWASLALGFAGALALWFCRNLVAEWVMGDVKYSRMVGWLSIGVFFTIVGGSQGALLNGLRRVGDMARTNVIGASLSAIIASISVYFLKTNGIIVFIISAPIMGFLIAAWFLRRVPSASHKTPWSAIFAQVKHMISLGSFLMLTGVAAEVTQLLVRTRINHTLGIESMGQFQVAWSISMMYIGFVLAAMGADFYPRLTAVIHDRLTANRIVNEQTEIALLLAGPVLVGMLALAPLVIDLLYTQAFRPAVTMLRWQIIGDLIKIISWPMGFIILARGAGRTFLLSEMSWNLCYLACIWFGLDFFGINAAGIGFLVSYIVYLYVVSFLAVKSTGFSLSSANKRIIILYLFVIVCVFLATFWWPRIAMVGGTLIAMILLIKSLITLSALADLQGPPARLAGGARNVLARLGVRNI